MARLGELDFQAFLTSARERNDRRFGGDTSDGDGEDRGAHAYAYASDHTTRKTFEKLKPVELAVAATVRSYKQFGKNQLLGQAVRVGPRQFPRVHELAGQCADTLGIAPPTVYVVNQPTMNAMTYGTDDDSFILVHSALVDHLSDAELRDVIGHECGHIHNKHVVYLTTLHYLQTFASLFTQYLVYPALIALRAWTRRAEITCDRAGLLCSRDLQVAERSLAKLALGSHKLYDQFNLEEFVQQFEEGQDGPGRFAEALASHPYIPKRILALRAFAESSLYRTHVGLGTDGLSMQAVDSRVHDIIKVVG